MILVNFKLAEQSFGQGAEKLAKSCMNVSKKTGVTIIPVVSAIDIRSLSALDHLKVMSQHMDPYDSGRFTGKTSPRQLAQSGAIGSLINHSEDKQPKGTILKLLTLVPKGFMTVVCVRSQQQAVFWAKKGVTYLAYEPPELIGSKTSSVSVEKRDQIERMVNLVTPIPLLVGAGVKSRTDVEVALAAGAKGVLVASAVVESEDPEHILKEMAEGFGVKSFS